MLYTNRPISGVSLLLVAIENDEQCMELVIMWAAQESLLTLIYTVLVVRKATGEAIPFYSRTNHINTRLYSGNSARDRKDFFPIFNAHHIF